MTIAAAYLVPDGVVFGTDGETKVLDKKGTLQQTHNNTPQIFPIEEVTNAWFAICCWGSPQVGMFSHRSVAARLKNQLGNLDSIAIVDKVKSIITAMVEETRNKGKINYNAGNFGYFLGGVNPNSHRPFCLQLNFQGDGLLFKEKEEERTKKSMELEEGEFRLAGGQDGLSSLLLGYDEAVKNRLITALKQRMPNDVECEKLVVDALRQETAALEYDMIPLRSAVDSLYTHLCVAARLKRRNEKVQGASGATEICVISPDKPFRRIDTPFQGFTL